MMIRKISLYLFLLITFNNIGQESKDQLTVEEKKEVIQGIQRILEKNYVFPEVANDINKLLEKKLHGYLDISSETAFTNALIQDIRSINHDQHLNIYYTPESAGNTELITVPSGDIERGKSTNYGFPEVRILEGNVGYVKLINFSIGDQVEAAMKSATHAMNFIQNSDAFIFDLRNNPGGSTLQTLYVLSYFFEEDHKKIGSYFDRPSGVTTSYNTVAVQGDKLTGRPVYILVNEESFSAPEMFAYTLQQYKKAVIMGTKTGGGANPGEKIRINDRFSIHVSTGRIINELSQTNWEQVGVTPDIKAGEKDMILSAHIRIIENMLNADTENKAYAKLLKKLKATQDPLNIKTTLLDQYTGTYSLEGGKIVTISRECGSLYGRMQGDEHKIKLIALSAQVFKAVGVDAKIVFAEDHATTTSLIFTIGGYEMKGHKVH